VQSFPVVLIFYIGNLSPEIFVDVREHKSRLMSLAIKTPAANEVFGSVTPPAFRYLSCFFVFLLEGDKKRDSFSTTAAKLIRRESARIEIPSLDTATAFHNAIRRLLAQSDFVPAMKFRVR